MKSLLTVLRIILYPLKFVVDIIYKPNSPRVVGYSWYSRSDYEKMVKTAKDEDIITSYDEWRNNAEVTIASLRNQTDWFILKVHMNNAELTNWLNNNKLVNSHENRQLFLGSKVSKFNEDPSIY